MVELARIRTCVSRRNLVYSQTVSTTHPQLRKLQIGSGGRTRTCNTLINSQILYRLSYAGIMPDRFFQERAKDQENTTAGPPIIAHRFGNMVRLRLCKSATYYRSSCGQDA